MSLGTLIIRADATIAIGSGHVMRCLALAQAWQEAGGDVVFAMTQTTAEMSQRIPATMNIAHLRATPGGRGDAEEVVELARSHQAEWVVTDGYFFDPQYQQNLREAGFKVLCVDDAGDRERYCADLVLNQNIYAEALPYSRRDVHTRLLLGSSYVMLRAEFARLQGRKRETAAVVRKILVTMGTSDPENVTELVIDALSFIKIQELAVTVVVGGSNPHIAGVESAMKRLSHDTRIHVSTTDMAGLMTQADLAISAGGGTCYELAFLRIPTVLITMAKNHERTCQVFGEREAAIDAGWFHTLSSEGLGQTLDGLISNFALRQSLIQNCRGLVDGLGVSRVIEAMVGERDAD